jgi:hypothetical protein
VQHALCAADAQVDADIAKAVERLTISKERAVARLAQIAFGDAGAGLPLAVVNPAQIRAFARATGRHERRRERPEPVHQHGDAGAVSVMATGVSPRCFATLDGR